MKRYEKAALALMALGIALAMLLAMSSDAGALTTELLWPGVAVAVALLCAAMVVAMVGWKKETGRKAVLFFELRELESSGKEGEIVTYREIMNAAHPDQCGPDYMGGCSGCPGDIIVGAPTQYEAGCEAIDYPDDSVCRRCWNGNVLVKKKKA